MLDAMNAQRQLLKDIEDFCAKHGIGVSEFGAIVFGNVAFVHYLRKGRNVRIDTYERARKFMDTYKPKGSKPRPRKAAANTVAA